MTGSKLRQKRDWALIIADWGNSGKSIKDFCFEAELHQSDFYRMKKKLSLADQKLVKIEQTVIEKKNSYIILETPGKYRLELQHDFSEVFLKRLISVLAESRCS